MQVICIKKDNLKKLNYRDLEHWLENPNHIYIGRHMVYVAGATSSKFKNPYSVKQYGRKRCLELYREYIITNQKLISELSELKNKILGCWCYKSIENPELNENCHGDILIELVNQLN
jgi:hypothetical protein